MISIFKALPFRSRIPSPRAICHLYSTQDWAEYHTDLPACQHCSGQTTDGFWSLTGHGKSLTSHCKHSPRQFHAWPQHTSAVSYFMCVFFFMESKMEGYKQLSRGSGDFKHGSQQSDTTLHSCTHTSHTCEAMVWSALNASTLPASTN